MALGTKQEGEKRAFPRQLKTVLVVGENDIGVSTVWVSWRDRLP
jgi:hypothetical protein